MSDQDRRSADEEIVTAALTLVAMTSPRAISRMDQVGDRIVVPRSALLKLRETIEQAYPGGEAATRRALRQHGLGPRA